MLAKLSADTSKWDRVIDKIEFATNNIVYSSRKETPRKLLFGVDQVGEVNDALKTVLSQNKSERDLEASRSKASEKLIKSQADNKKNYNVKRKAAQLYKEGDYVMIRNVDTSVGINKKLLPKLKGPYIVKKVLGNDRYVITDIDGFNSRKCPTMECVHLIK